MTKVTATTEMGGTSAYIHNQPNWLLLIIHPPLIVLTAYFDTSLYHARISPKAKKVTREKQGFSPLSIDSDASVNGRERGRLREASCQENMKISYGTK